jgi:vacuolar-type H+-ATPase subunit E/Vma4
VAIADILTRIELDAATEASDITTAAESEAARIVAHAEATVAAERAAALEGAERNGASEAATLLAGARLEARDSLRAGKRAMAERVLERAREALETLPDAEYLEVIAAGVAEAASGGETLMIAPADAKRLSALGALLKTRGADVVLSADPAPIDRGVLLTGDRVRVEVSPSALVDDHRDELLLVAASELFGEKE